MEIVRVVVADDNVQLRNMITEYLSQQSGMEIVGAAANGLETIEQVQEKQPDVLICDMIMPQMDGYGVLERLLEMKLEKQPKVIALTALGRDDFISRAIDLGVCYYMVKPFDFAMLAQRIYEAAGEEGRADALNMRMHQESSAGADNLDAETRQRLRDPCAYQGLSVPARGREDGHRQSRPDEPHHQGALPGHRAPLRHDE